MLRLIILLFLYKDVFCNYTCNDDGDYIKIKKDTFTFTCIKDKNIIGCKEYSKVLDDNFKNDIDYICNGDTYILCKKDFWFYYGYICMFSLMETILFYSSAFIICFFGINFILNTIDYILGGPISMFILSRKIKFTEIEYEDYKMKFNFVFYLLYKRFIYKPIFDDNIYLLDNIDENNNSF